jgi:ribonuclease E
MAEKMLIDASHPEETRVVVVRGNRIEEFDFESEHKKQLRGNIYLAKVTRVEPSLQAAFVDYGGNRHGFLAFSEIHPDYYQIPLADRQALLQAEAEDAENDPDFESADEAETGPAKSRSKSKSKSEAKTAEDEEGSEDGKSTKSRPRRSRRGKKTADPAKASDDAAADDADATSNEDSGSETGAISADELAAAAAANETDAAAGTEAGKDDDDKPTEMAADVEADEISEPVSRRKRKSNDDDDASGDDESVESVGSEDAMEEVPTRSQRKPRKQYRIQEVIKRRQIMLVQVVKEERGNKGAALDNLSFAGRPLFRTDAEHRARRRHFAQDHQRIGPQASERGRQGAQVPQGMGVILRTAGANRTKAEIKRDYEYLMRMWDSVRELTLKLRPRRASSTRKAA